MPDSEIVYRMARGDNTALGVLYDRYGGVLYREALAILRSPADAEEITQDVFLAAWRFAADFDSSRGTVRAWLVVRARSRALDRRRAARRRSVELDAPAATLPDFGPDQLTTRASVACLPAELGCLITLGYVRGLTTSEMARELGIPQGTVKSRTARALLLLRDLLGSLPDRRRY